MQFSHKTHAIIKSLTTKKMRKRAYRYITRTQNRIRRIARHASLSSNGKHVPVRLHKLQHNDFPTYFGYYDKTPFSRDESKILATVFTVKNDWRRSSMAHPLKVGYFNAGDAESGAPDFHEFGETHSWSWQQGCMLQWFPSGPDSYVFYNCIVQNGFGAVIQDIHTGKIVQQLDTPLYALAPGGGFGAGLNFSRLERLRPGYGYAHFKDNTEGLRCPGDDGIWFVDMQTGRKELLLSYRNIAEISPVDSMRNAEHYVNHLMIGPGDSRVIFLHVWLPDAGNPDFRRNRLMCFDFSAGRCFVVDDSAIVSHYSWVNEREILSTRFHPENGWQYVRYEIELNEEVRCYSLDQFKIGADGHPTYSPSRDLIVTDREDEYGELHPLLINLKDNSIRDLGGFYRPGRYFDTVRCDLHPRWDRSGKRICFDSAHEGKRAMYLTYVNE